MLPKVKECIKHPEIKSIAKSVLGVAHPVHEQTDMAATNMGLPKAM